jgi:hypothetical protein
MRSKDNLSMGILHRRRTMKKKFSSPVESTLSCVEGKGSRVRASVEQEKGDPSPERARSFLEGDDEAGKEESEEEGDPHVGPQEVLHELHELIRWENEGGRPGEVG